MYTAKGPNGQSGRWATQKRVARMCLIAVALVVGIEYLVRRIDYSLQVSEVRVTEKYEHNQAECDAWLEKPNTFDTFTSQYGQDRWLWVNFFEKLQDAGVKGRYLDTACAFPRLISNTFFFEKCVEWEGLCVDADPAKAHAFKTQRTCRYENKCISRDAKNLEFWSSETDGTAHVVTGWLNHWRYYLVGGWKKEVVPCEALSQMVEKSTLGTHVDFWSLDLEGMEMEALNSFDFKNVKVDIVVGEDMWEDTVQSKFLVSKGFISYGKVHGLSAVDALFIRKGSIWDKYCKFTRRSDNGLDVNCDELDKNTILKRASFV